MFTLSSIGIKNGSIQDKYGKYSDNIINEVPQLSFPLTWDNAPAETVSFAFIFQDYDDIPDEGVSWIHWLVADIPAAMKGLAENASRENRELVQGKNSWMTPFDDCAMGDEITCFYGGPAPDRTHEYEIEIYALDAFMKLKTGFYYNELRKLMRGHILDTAVLRGTYGG